MPEVRRFRLPLRIVFYREADSWIAHCLEFDLLGDGPTKEAAMETLCEAIAIQFEASAEWDNPDNLFTPADGQYFKMFAEGEDVAEAVMAVSLDRLRQSEGAFIDGALGRVFPSKHDPIPA